MITEIKTAVIDKMRVRIVQVQVQTRHGHSGFKIVGLGDRAVSESRHRIFSAFRQAGFKIPSNILVNLAPVDFKKVGAGFDLAIALALLKACNLLKQTLPADAIVLGELALDAGILPVQSELAIIYQARQLGFKNFVISSQGGSDLDLLPDIRVLSLSSIKDSANIKFVFTAPKPRPLISVSSETPSSSDILALPEQKIVWRAVTIALAGNHHLLLRGAPGVGKSLIVNNLVRLLPTLTANERLEIATIHSLVPSMVEDRRLVGTRPFRTPAQNISLKDFLGSSKTPGELCLAHNGILFLDELSQFSSQLLDAMRVPLEAAWNLEKSKSLFPIKFLMIAATNNCPCGQAGTKSGLCQCSAKALSRFHSKFSAPLLDRIDLQVEVRGSEIEDIHRFSKEQALSITKLDDLKNKIGRVRSQSNARFGCYNSEISESIILSRAKILPETFSFLEALSKKRALSVRRYFRVLRVARTIADLANNSTVSPEHMAEAISYSG